MIFFDRNLTISTKAPVPLFIIFLWIAFQKIEAWYKKVLLFSGSIMVMPVSRLEMLIIYIHIMDRNKET